MYLSCVVPNVQWYSLVVTDFTTQSLMFSRIPRLTVTKLPFFLFFGFAFFLFLFFSGTQTYSDTTGLFAGRLQAN